MDNLHKALGVTGLFSWMSISNQQKECEAKGGKWNRWVMPWESPSKYCSVGGGGSSKRHRRHRGGKKRCNTRKHRK